jgi:AcrR family transcriptional regulator
MRHTPAKPARRRAKQERSLQTIAAILEAGARVLQREGYARATTNRISEVAGVSVGTIYQYFADKDQIFDALIRREVEGLGETLRSFAFHPEEPLTDSLQRLLQLLVRARPDAPALYRSLEHVPNALFRRRLAEARGGIIEWVSEFLAYHQKKIRVPDLEVAAFLVVAAAEGVAMNASLDFYRARGADELATMLTRYLTGARELYMRS